MRKWVRGEKKVEKNTEYQYKKRVEKYAIQALKDLALLAEKLPEEQLAQIFDSETVRPFFASLLALKSDDEKRRHRIIGIWGAILGTMPEFYGSKLVSKDAWRALTLRGDRNLEAIYYATMFHEPNKKE